MAPISAALTKLEVEKFEAVFSQLVDDLVNDKKMKDMPETLKWTERVLNFNVPHGKKVRGLMVPMSLKSMVDEPSEENMHLASVLGWCVEILQASFLVADDIMDASETRRGQPCWYKVDNMGAIAFNDSLLLEHVVYRVLAKYFHDKSYYTQLVDLFLEVTYKTIFGQSLDTQTGNNRDMDEYTMDRLTAIIKYKTSYYTTYLSVALTMAMVGKTDLALMEKVEKIALEIGHYFQIQDDYLDCFGDEKVTGKYGTDIQDCKCCWPFVIAKTKCTPDQLDFLKANYGINDKGKIDAVKKLYHDLDIPGEYERYEEEAYESIRTQVKEIRDQLPPAVFMNLLNMLYKRAK